MLKHHHEGTCICCMFNNSVTSNRVAANGCHGPGREQHYRVRAVHYVHDATHDAGGCASVHGVEGLVILPMGFPFSFLFPFPSPPHSQVHTFRLAFGVIVSKLELAVRS